MHRGLLWIVHDSIHGLLLTRGAVEGHMQLLSGDVVAVDLWVEEALEQDGEIVWIARLVSL
jgi:hypothetical protein